MQQMRCKSGLWCPECLWQGIWPCQGAQEGHGSHWTMSRVNWATTKGHHRWLHSDEYKPVWVCVWAEHRLEQQEFSRAWHLQICNEEADSWLTLCPLRRPSEEDFQLLIRTVWSLCRCNFLNSISVALFLVYVCLLVICLCSRTLRSFLPLTVASCPPPSLPSSFPGPSYFLCFSLFPPFSP